MTHYLKTWKSFYKSVADGSKRFEIRINDRDYNLGDTLVLQEYDTQLCDLTGKSRIFKVAYILYGPAFGLSEGFCCMSLEPIFFL